MEDHHDVPLVDCWYAQPQLFFTCHLHPISGRLPKNGLFKICPDDQLYHLVFFNTFEELKLPMKGPMEEAGVINLYECPLLHVSMWLQSRTLLAEPPLFPLFLAGNSTLTVPHCYSKCKDSGFPMGCADSAAVDGRRGSNVYEVNP